MRALLCNLALVAAASFSVGCLNVIGTSEYKPCTDENGDDVCDDGSGGGSSTSSGSTASGSSSGSSSSSSTATECFDVTATVTGNVKVKLSSIDADFEAGFSGPICAPAGSLTLSAECDASGGDDPPIAVEWGNEACEDDTTSCTFDLEGPETFTISADDCP